MLALAAFAVGAAGDPAAAPASPAPASTASTAPAISPGPAPSLRFDATTIDLGSVVRGDDAVAEFTYSNVGDGPLKILSAKPG
jgi:hypothetical protein